MQNATMSPKPKRTHKLSQEWKLVARTAPELYEQFYAFVAAMASRAGVKFRGRKLGREATLNAIVIHFFDQEEAEQARILREYVPRYEAILGDAPDVDLDPAEEAGAAHEEPQEVVKPAGYRPNDRTVYGHLAEEDPPLAAPAPQELPPPPSPKGRRRAH